VADTRVAAEDTTKAAAGIITREDISEEVTIREVINKEDPVAPEICKDSNKAHAE
jgi:CBS domain containing-hemolysin-like protein